MERVQMILSAQELAAVDDFRFKHLANACNGPRNLRERLGCFGVSAFRARLAFSIVHVSVRPRIIPDGRNRLGVRL